MNSMKFIAPIVLIGVIAVTVYFYSSSGYGRVSPDAYEVATALYGTCRAKSEERLAAVERIMDEDADRKLELSEAERRWLEEIVEQARNGKWQKAADAARRMMEDQVDY